MKLHGQNFIGNTLSGNGNQTFQGENPATRTKLETDFHEATSNEINEAIAKANEAFSVYSKKSGKEKAGFLEAIADEILALGDDLIKRCMEETGLPEARLIGERGRTMNQLKLFASVAREGSWVDARVDFANPDRQPLPKPDVRSMFQALGPVGIFGASNFPLAFSVAGGDTASALAAGCPIVVKAHPSHPGTCELVATAIVKAVEKCDMPDGTFSMVQGPSVDVGMGIVRNPYIKAIGFTGSFRGGKALFDEANKRPEPIPVYAEMGSTNPVIILPEALKERKEAIAKDLTGSVILGTGQFCTNPGLVFVEESPEKDEFKSLLTKSFQEASSAVMLNSGIQKAYQGGIKSLETSEGVNVLAKGIDGTEGYFATPYAFETTVDNFLKDKHLEEEVFGPSTLLTTIDQKEKLVQVIEKLSGHLTITIHATESDLKNYQHIIPLLEKKAGRLIINGYPTGVEVCHSMVHGGPYPATTDSRTTSVGTMAITRFARPVCYQNFPQFLLPDELKDENPLHIWRLVDGEIKQ